MKYTIVASSALAVLLLALAWGALSGAMQSSSAKKPPAGEAPAMTRLGTEPARDQLAGTPVEPWRGSAPRPPSKERSATAPAGDAVSDARNPGGGVRRARMSVGELNEVHWKLRDQYLQAAQAAMDLQQQFGLYETRILERGSSTFDPTSLMEGSVPVGFRVEQLDGGTEIAKLFPLTEDLHPELHQLKETMQGVHEELHERGACTYCAVQASEAREH